MTDYISHFKDLHIIQTNEEHSHGVADRAECFAAEFGMGEWGRLLGLLHDKGKETDLFQAHIMKHMDPQAKVDDTGYKEHAYVGGLMAFRDYRQAAGLLCNPIFGHHRGLLDNGHLMKRLKEESLPKGVEPIKGIASPTQPKLRINPEDFHHLQRMLFSCLVDADFLDTEQFMDPEASKTRLGKKSLMELLPLLENKYRQFASSASKNKVNEVRAYVQQRCREMSQTGCGCYSLTVPTGGGKTLSSVLWAMLHAIHNGQKRIIIAIPYTSIIVQTAAILKEIFGEENVLEHHSSFNPMEDLKDDSLRSRVLLATENWDYPIVVTTNVQLFESMMSNRPSDCRKLHNIVNSVLVLDEVQMLPTEFLQPIVHALSSYQRLFGISVLFTTASQPILQGHIRGNSSRVGFDALDQITPIIPDEANLHEALRRVKLEIDETPKSYEEVADALMQHDRVLCIVNTRRDAKEIYEQLKARMGEEGVLLHLSRMMCPLHVSQIIAEIKQRLKDPECPLLRVVATQLVEAGVDIDFPVVYRQQTGLDSLLQAAGRCNREGKLSIATTYSFALQRPLPPGLMTRANYARMDLPKEADWFAPETMTQFFLLFFSRVGSFDKADIKTLLENPREMQFETAAKEFRLIEDNTTVLVINWGDSMDYVAELQEKGPSYGLLRKLSQYSVSVRKYDLKKLLDMGAIEEVIRDVFVVKERAQYDANVGLLTSNHWLEEILCI